MTRTRHRFTPPERRHIARRDLYLCRYCGWPVWPWQDADIAHEVSVANGGSDALSNVAWSHSHCNRSAGSENMRPSQRFSTATLVVLAVIIALSIVFAITSLS